MSFATIPEAVEELRAGRILVVVDDEDRENEGDLTMAAEKVTPEAINFMAKYGRGLVCLAMTEERLEYLRLGQMSAENTSNFGTAFTDSIDAKEGVTTGISATTARVRFRWRSIPRRDPTTWRVRDTFFPCARARAAYWCVPGRLRRPLIWRVWPAWFLRA